MSPAERSLAVEAGRFVGAQLHTTAGDITCSGPIPSAIEPWQHGCSMSHRRSNSHFATSSTRGLTMRGFVKTVLGGIAAIALSASAANAATVIDFGTGFGGAGGTINIGANVTGSGIFIDTVTIVGAPVNNGVFDVEGAGVCGDAVGGCGLLSFDKNLNTITLVGSIPALGILAPVNLLSGDLSGGVNVLINNGVTGSITASGLDSKSRELLLAIGLD